jgi:hypothetical protein
MNEPALRDKVIEEIGRIPEDRLAELFDFVHFFRIGLEATELAPVEPMKFAGAWAEMAEETFQGLLVEVAKRRRGGFSRRRGVE